MSMSVLHKLPSSFLYSLGVLFERNAVEMNFEYINLYNKLLKRVCEIEREMKRTNDYKKKCKKRRNMCKRRTKKWEEKNIKKLSTLPSWPVSRKWLSGALFRCDNGPRRAAFESLPDKRHPITFPHPYVTRILLGIFNIPRETAGVLRFLPSCLISYVALTLLNIEILTGVRARDSDKFHIYVGHVDIARRNGIAFRAFANVFGKERERDRKKILPDTE